MTRRQRRSGSGYMRAALESLLTDAVTSASDAAAEAWLASDGVVSGRGGIRTVFAASLKAVAGAKPGDMSRDVFDTALAAAEKALDESLIPSAYERMRKIIISIPDRLVWMAARQAAVDVFHGLPAGARTAGGDSLLSMMKGASADASRARLGTEDGKRAVRAASEAAGDLADIAHNAASEMVLAGIPVHAATVAVFEVGIRGTAPGTLADAVAETCRDLPESARRHDDMTVALVVALSTIVAIAAADQQKYQTAVGAAEQTCRNEAADRTRETIYGKTFETIYGALAACAYAVSNGRMFEAEYEDALAVACGVDTRESRVDMPAGLSPADMDEMFRTLVPDIMGQMPKSALQQVYQKMPADILLSGFEEDDEHRLLGEAMSVDYKEAAADPDMADMLSLYKTAYGAGCEGAGAVAKSRGVQRLPRRQSGL